MKDYIFVSHSSKDDRTVRQFVTHLESSGVRCWVSYRDIPPGADWAETIYDAIASSCGMILLFSENVNRSRQIRNELDIATNLEKTIVPVKLDDAQPAKSIRYFTSSHQWLNAEMGWKQAFPNILETVDELLEADLEIPPGPQEKARGKRRSLIFALCAAIMLIGIIGFFRIFAGGSDSEEFHGMLNMVAGGSVSWDYATDIISTSDGGFTATGTWDWGFWSRWWTAHFDSTAELEWVWSDSLAGEDKPLLLPAAGEGVFCATGEYADFDHTGFPLRIVRFDGSGAILWEREWWLEWSGAVQPELASLSMNADSLIILYFTLRQLGSEPMRATHQIIVDASGEFIRRDTVRNSDTAREAFPLQGGNVLRIFREIPSRGNGIEIVSTEGTVLDSAIIGDTRSQITSGLQLPGGDIVLLMTEDSYGEGKGNLAVMRFSPDLDLLWRRVYGGSLSDGATDALLLPDGDILVCGYSSSFGDGSRDGWLLRLDQQGELIWQQTLDMGGDEYLYSMSRSPNGRIYAGGSSTMNGDPDAWLLELDAEGSWNAECENGIRLFAEDWEKGYIDQTIWDMGYNRNYTPALHMDSVRSSWTFDSNNVPIVSIGEYPLTPGLRLSADVMVPDMPGARGNNWLAIGMTRSSTEDFHLDPGYVSDMELKWVYTEGINDQRCELTATCIHDSLRCSSSKPESDWLQRGEFQDLTIETCDRTVRFWVDDSLFYEDSVEIISVDDSVRIYLWGNSGSVPHMIDNLRLQQIRW